MKILKILSPIPKRSAEINSQVRNETNGGKVEELRKYFKEELSKIWVTLSSLSLQARQSGGKCDTQKELFDFIKEKRIFENFKDKKFNASQ